MLSATKLCTHALLSSFLLISIISLHVSCFEFEVGGGTRGWVKPVGNESETYNEWAQQNRFHIGDTIVFNYDKSEDSVLEVNKQDYQDCDTSNPISKYGDGNTLFKFDRSGFFYFISGKEDHCEAGQKLIIRVMVQSASLHPPVSAPVQAPEEGGSSPIGSEPPSAGGGDDGSWGGSDGFDAPGPAMNATAMLSVTSFMTGLAGVLVVLYLFMN